MDKAEGAAAARDEELDEADVEMSDGEPTPACDERCAQRGVSTTVPGARDGFGEALASQEANNATRKQVLEYHDDEIDQQDSPTPSGMRM